MSRYLRAVMKRGFPGGKTAGSTTRQVDVTHVSSNDSGFGSQSSNLSNVTQIESQSEQQPDVRPKVRSQQVHSSHSPDGDLSDDDSVALSTDAASVCWKRTQYRTSSDTDVTIPDYLSDNDEIIAFLIEKCDCVQAAVEYLSVVVAKRDYGLLVKFIQKLAVATNLATAQIYMRLLPDLKSVWDKEDSFSQAVQKYAHIWKVLTSQLPEFERDGLFIHYLRDAFQQKNLVRVVQTLNIMELYDVKRIVRHTPQLCDEAKYLNFHQMKVLSCDSIEKLYYFSDRYIIPASPKKAKMVALIAYNDFQGSKNSSPRNGANKEAAIMEDALKHAGFHVIKVKSNWIVEELRKWIKEMIAQYRNECSLLWVTIMTHGGKGTILGRDGGELPVNEVLMDMHKLPGSRDEHLRLRECTPAVLVVQACQGTSSFCRYPIIQSGQEEIRIQTARAAQHPAQHSHALRATSTSPGRLNRGYGYNEQGIITSNSDVEIYGHLKEDYPVQTDSKHTAVIMSTRHGYLSHRNHFIPCLAKELKQVDGKVALETIIVRTSQAMEKHFDQVYAEQDPVYIHNFKRSLILPKPLIKCIS